MSCDMCGNSLPTQVGRGRPKKYCSDLCIELATREDSYRSDCQQCGVTFRHNRSSRMYCSWQCKYEHNKPDPVTYDMRCELCLSPFNTRAHNARYCEDCRRPHIGGMRRAARKRGATAETVDPFIVFDRDGWVCKLCTVDTPKHKRGTYDDDAPELDHIHPLSKGGEHSYDNTWLLCRSCNQVKSARVLHLERWGGISALHK